MYKRQVKNRCLEHGSRTSDDQSVKVFLQKLEVHMKHLKMLQEQPTISCSSVCKQEDWLGSVAQVFQTRRLAEFVNKSIGCDQLVKCL